MFGRFFLPDEVTKVKHEQEEETRDDERLSLEIGCVAHGAGQGSTNLYHVGFPKFSDGFVLGVCILYISDDGCMNYMIDLVDLQYNSIVLL